MLDILTTKQWEIGEVMDILARSIDLSTTHAWFETSRWAGGIDQW